MLFGGQRIYPPKDAERLALPSIGKAALRRSVASAVDAASLERSIGTIGAIGHSTAAYASYDPYGPDARWTLGCRKQAYAAGADVARDRDRLRLGFFGVA